MTIVKITVKSQKHVLYQIL